MLGTIPGAFEQAFQIEHYWEDDSDNDVHLKEDDGEPKVKNQGTVEKFPHSQVGWKALGVCPVPTETSKSMETLKRNGVCGFRKWLLHDHFLQ